MKMKSFGIALATIASSCIGASAAAAPAAQPVPIGIVAGPPNAKVRISIVSSFSCPHCRVFDAAAMNELYNVWTRKGVQVEVVPYILTPVDVATTIASTCGASSGFARRSTILFRAQPQITANWSAAPDAQKNAAVGKPRAAGADAIARLSGVYSLAGALGLTEKQLRTCMNDQARQRALGVRNRAADARWNVEGTPTVVINGRKVSSAWPAARAELARIVSQK